MPGAHGWNEKLASDSEASVSSGVKHCRLRPCVATSVAYVVALVQVQSVFHGGARALLVNVSAAAGIHWLVRGCR